MNLDHAQELLNSLNERVSPVPGEVRLDGNDIVIDNPSARGAMSVSMMLDLAGCVQRVLEQRLPYVRLMGTSGAFCSGGHLVQVREGLLKDDGGLQMCLAMTAVVDALATGPVVVGWLDGPALGGGAEIVTACDAVFVGPRARLGFVHTRLGVAPGWGGARRLRDWIGVRPAVRMLASAEVVDADMLLERGMADGRLEAGEAFLERLRSHDAAAILGAKEQLLDPSNESAVFASLWGSPSHRRRISG